MVPPRSSISCLPTAVSATFFIVSKIGLSGVVQSAPPGSEAYYDSSGFQASVSVFESLPFSLRCSLTQMVTLSVPPTGSA